MSDPLELLRARYGAAHVPGSASQYAPDAINPVLETLLAHRSVRGFKSDALPGGTLELLIAAAQSAPSSSNLQTFSVVALEEPERKSRIATLAADQQFICEAPLFLSWLADLSRLEHIAAAENVEAEGLQYLDTFLMAAIDAALAAQNVVTAAESLGLGTVYVGALRNKPLDVARELGLPKGVFPLFGQGSVATHSAGRVETYGLWNKAHDTVWSSSPHKERNAVPRAIRFNPQGSDALGAARRAGFRTEVSAFEMHAFPGFALRWPGVLLSRLSGSAPPDSRSS